MKSSNQHILETFIINKDYSDGKIVVKSFDELRKIIEDRYDKLGPGTKDNLIDFNDVDVSNLDSFYSRNIDKGIFEGIKFKYIDISDWDVSNVTNMRSMFFRCKSFNQDLSSWDISNVIYKDVIFYHCPIKNEYKPKFK